MASRWWLLLLMPAALMAANAPPTIAAVPAQVLAEDQTAVVLTLTGIGPGDPAESAQTLTVTVASDLSDLVTASLTYVGGDTAVLVLTPQPDQFGATVVRVSVRDDGGGTDTTVLPLAVTITAVEDPPTCTVPATWTIDEDETGYSNMRLWLPISGLSGGPANEGGGTVYPSAYSTDPARLKVTSTFFELPDNTAARFLLEPQPDATGDVEVAIRLQDPAGTVAFVYATVHITPVNDAPRIVCGPMAVARGGSLTLTTAGLTVTDADLPPAGDLQIILTSTPTRGELERDGVALALDAVFPLQDILDGRISYTNDGTSDDPGIFAVAASDGIAAASASVQVGIQILGHARPFVAVAESAGSHDGSWMSELAAGGLVLAGDSPAFAGGFLRATILNPDADDTLFIADLGSGSGQIGSVNGRVSYGGVAIGTLSGGRGALPLQITLSGEAADATAVQALLRALCFLHVGLDPSPDPRRIEIVVDDGVNGTSVPAVVTLDIVQLDDWPAVPAGTRLATLPGLSRTFLLGAIDPDRTPTLTAWSVSAQPGNATVTILDSVVAGGPLVRLDPLLPGPGMVTLEQSLGGTSRSISLPVEVGSLDAARPHPCADPPREAAAGDTVEIDVPWDTRDLGAEATLTFTAAGAIPAGLDLSGLAGNHVRLSLPIPAGSTPGTRIRFLILAEDRTRGFPGFLPIDLTVRPLPAGGG